MSPALVCDASALAALLLDAGAAGSWVTDQISSATLLAPNLAPFETANVIRRQEQRESISADQAAQAHADLLDLDVEYWPYDLLAERAWRHRRNLSVYDAAYVALAELTSTALVTLDERIADAPGLRCPVLTPTSLSV